MTINFQTIEETHLGENKTLIQLCWTENMLVRNELCIVSHHAFSNKLMNNFDQISLLCVSIHKSCLKLHLLLVLITAIFLCETWTVAAKEASASSPVT